MLIYHTSTAAEAMHPVKFGEAFRPKIHQLRAEAAKIIRQHSELCLDKSTPFGGVILGSNPSGAAT